jgi:hypothetical protein
MNNLETLWAYLKVHAPPGGIPGETGKYRDLEAYHAKKLERWAEGGTRIQLRANGLIDDPLLVCGLKRNGTELTDHAAKAIPVVAMLLAMSIVLNVNEDTLRKARTILAKSSAGDIEGRLKRLLSTGDLIASVPFPRLQLKNFKSVSIGTERVVDQYVTGAEEAYGAALDLLKVMSSQLLQAPSGMPIQFNKTFTSYFGNPDDEQEVMKLGFQGGAQLGLGGTQPRSAIVRAVLNCVWRGVQSRNVRLYFGGGSVIPNVVAYTPELEKTHKDGRVNIHLAIDFFDHDRRVNHDGMSVSRGGVLIHEFTHALAGTIDVGQAFVPGLCKNLTNEKLWGASALTNAQSYASFVEDAFG